MDDVTFMIRLLNDNWNSEAYDAVGIADREDIIEEI